VTDTLANAVREMRASGRYDVLLAAIPYARMLGLTAAIEDGVLVTHMTPQERLIGNPVLPALHGGTVGALMESAAILELLREGDTPRVPKTINLTVDYLRSARVLPTHARATITRQGRRVANVQMHAWQEDPERPIAVAHAHFLLRSGA
jgi:uncharacterized protein (TIGR00369 family)